MSPKPLGIDEMHFINSNFALSFKFSLLFHFIYDKIVTLASLYFLNESEHIHITYACQSNGLWN